MNWKEKMIQQLEMRLDERKNDPNGFEERMLTDALINSILEDCDWEIPVGLEPEMETWDDDEAPGNEETEENRVRFDGYEVVTTGSANEHFFRKQVLRLQDGSVVFAAYTSTAKNRPGEPGGAPMTAVVSCRKALRDLLQDESVEELVLNPGTDDLFIGKQQAEYLLHAAERQITPRPPMDFRLKRGISYRMAVGTPLDQDAFSNVERVLRALRDMKFEFLICEILRHEESKGGYVTDYVQAIFGSREGILRVEICLTWEMNGIKHRMLLYDEMPTEETVEFFRELLMQDRIPERTRDFHVYFEDKAYAEEEKE